jgi:hypothetical protein
MIIIETKYHGPTNSRGSRISARTPTWPDVRVTVPYAHELSGADVHAVAAVALIARIGERFPSGDSGLSLEPNGWDGRPRVASAGDRGYFFIARTEGE